MYEYAIIWTDEHGVEHRDVIRHRTLAWWRHAWFWLRGRFGWHDWLHIDIEVEEVEAVPDA